MQTINYDLAQARVSDLRRLAPRATPGRRVRPPRRSLVRRLGCLLVGRAKAGQTPAPADVSAEDAD